MTLFELLSFKWVCSRDYDWFKTFRLFLCFCFSFFSRSLLQLLLTRFFFVYTYSRTHTGSFLSSVVRMRLLLLCNCTMSKINEFVFRMHSIIAFASTICCACGTSCCCDCLIYFPMLYENACVNHLCNICANRWTHSTHSWSKPIFDYFQKFCDLL